MQGFFNSIMSFFGSLANAISIEGMYAIGTIVSIPMAVIFIAEVFGYQFVARAPFFVKVARRWNTKAVGVMAMTAALSVVLQVAGSLIVLVPGTLTLRLDAMVRTSFGAIFGMPAVWGVMLSNIIGDALAGTLGPGSVAGFIISWWVPYLFYRFYRPSESAMESFGLMVRYYLLTLLWCLIGSLFLCTNFQMLGLLPTDVVWTIVFPAVIVSTFLGAILGPVLARVVAPIAKRYGLAREEMGFEPSDKG